MSEIFAPKLHIMSPYGSSSPRWEFSHVEHGSYDPLWKKANRSRRGFLGRRRRPLVESASKKSGPISRALAEMRLFEVDRELAKAGNVAKAGALALAPLALVAGAVEAANHVSVDPELMGKVFHTLQQAPFNQAVLFVPMLIAASFLRKVEDSRRPLREKEGRLRVNSDW